MEDNLPVEPANEPTSEPVAAQPVVKEKAPEVITVRTWKEYVGESILIIFSVVLALVLTEYINNLHEKERTNEILHQLKLEVIKNKQSEDTQYAYHVQVVKNIDSALKNPAFAKQFIDSGRLNLKVLAPDGVMRKDLNDVSWQVAKQNNIFSKIDFDTYSLLTDIYDNQMRITNAEDKLANVLLSWESRKPENLHTTLLLLKDNYKGWVVDRAPALLVLYQKAIELLEAY